MKADTMSAFARTARLPPCPDAESMTVTTMRIVAVPPAGTFRTV
jgi:hypothetical protein